jgi:hypothetical protein
MSPVRSLDLERKEELLLSKQLRQVFYITKSV